MNVTDSLEKLKKIDERAEEGFDAIQIRRNAWERTAEEIILPALREALDAMGISKKYRSLYIRHDKVFDNFSSVQFWYGTIPTGIRMQRGQEFAIGLELGAALLFSQSDDGGVATIAYPFETLLPEQKRKRRRGTYLGRCFDSPSDIRREDVLEIASSFAEWAEGMTIFKKNISKSSMGAADTWKELVDGVVAEESDNLKSVIENTREILEKMRNSSEAIEDIRVNLTELHDEFEEREIKRMLAKAEPKTKKFLKRFVEMFSKGLIKESELDF